MAKVENIERLLSRLRARQAKAEKETEVSVIVGYTAAYAVFVHENMQAHHNVGQAKFLEQPARELQPELRRIVSEVMRTTKSLARALLMAGLRLQRESQLLCPVDTGNLRASAFTRLEGGEE